MAPTTTTRTDRTPNHIINKSPTHRIIRTDLTHSKIPTITRAMATTPPTSSTIIIRVSVASTTIREVTSVETTTHAAATTTEAAEATTEVVVATAINMAANASSLIWAVSRCSRDTRCLNSKCPCPCRCKCQWPQSRATWSRFLSSIWASSILWLRNPPL